MEGNVVIEMNRLEANKRSRAKVYLKKGNRTPVVGVEFNPIVYGLPLESLEFRWYRNVCDRMISCCVHYYNNASIHCLACRRLNLPIEHSYHCSPECYYDNHDKGHWAHGSYAFDLDNDLSIEPDQLMVDEDEDLWLAVGNSKSYIPTLDDFGCMLRMETRILDPTITPKITTIFITDHVIIAPSNPRPRCITPVGSPVKFRVLSYNILADYCIMKNYKHCPAWSQTWEYRRQNLLREITAYDADIVCLQEVQRNHFEIFFRPELEDLGYSAQFASKTNLIYTEDGAVIDGCATFFRRNRFGEVQDYKLKFPEIAQAVLDELDPSRKKPDWKVDEKTIRLTKDNVANVTVLELLKDNAVSDDSPLRLCVANTHIHANEDCKDVKLWQVATLINGLQNIGDPSIPILICGDLNSCPRSAPYDLIVLGKVDASHAEWPDDPMHLFDQKNLSHNLHLASAYRVGQASQGEKINSLTGEPRFTHVTDTFSGTLDYIFFSEDTLKLNGLLELVDPEDIARRTCLPSPECSSDHIALLAEFSLAPLGQNNHPLPEAICL